MEGNGAFISFEAGCAQIVATQGEKNTIYDVHCEPEWCVPKQWELGGEGLVCAKLNEIDDVRTKFILTVCCFATSHALSRFSCDAPHLFPRMNHSSLHGCRQGCGQELSEILK